MVDRSGAPVRGGSEEGALPFVDDAWADVRVLGRVRELSSRHAAVLLPLEAVIEAVERALAARDRRA